MAVEASSFVPWWPVFFVPRRLLLCLPQVLQDSLEGIDDFLAAHAGFRKAQLEVEQLGGRLVGEREMLRAAGLRFRDRLADLLTRRAALARDLFDESGHFLGCVLPNYL